MRRGGGRDAVGDMSTERVPDLSAESLLAGWTPRRVGRRILVFSEVDSTNTVALDRAGEAESDGLVVLADYQTRGRGRQGRTWESPRGASILCSVLLVFEDTDASGAGRTPSVGGWLTLASAVAACDAIRESVAITPAIKWPNDLRVRGRKVGGILIESRAVGAGGGGGARGSRAWGVGIGINCLQQRGHFTGDWGERATSLELESAHVVSRAAVALSLLRALDRRLGGASVMEAELDAMHADWLAYAEPLGQRVGLVSEGRTYAGTTVAVEPSGGLIVQTDDGRRQWFDPMRTSLLP